MRLIYEKEETANNRIHGGHPPLKDKKFRFYRMTVLGG